MALTQYNQFDPKLGPVNGVMQQEPRVFAHDAVAVVVGAINASDANKGLTITSGGTGYSEGDTLTYNAGSAAGAGLVLTVLAETGGVVTDFTVTNAGSGYLLTESLTFTGGANNFTADVSNIDIPNTQKRGCCIYVGAAAGLATLSVVMESGNTAVFNTISGGTIFPILIKRITTAGLAANDVIALY